MIRVICAWCKEIMGTKSADGVDSTNNLFFAGITADNKADSILLVSVLLVAPVNSR